MSWPIVIEVCDPVVGRCRLYLGRTIKAADDADVAYTPGGKIVSQNIFPESGSRDGVGCSGPWRYELSSVSWETPQLAMPLKDFFGAMLTQQWGAKDILPCRWRWLVLLVGVELLTSKLLTRSVLWERSRGSNLESSPVGSSFITSPRYPTILYFHQLNQY